jgi:ABC-type glycerol-3-phosphate transport system substrate-binding protein
MKRSILSCVAATMIAVAGPALATELTVWDFKSGDPVTQSYYAAAKDTFEKAHPGVTVTFVMQPHDQYYTLLGAALSASGGPDLVMVHGGAQAVSRVGYFLRLDDKIADIKPDMTGWSEFTGPDGGIYGVPLTEQGFVVYYNKKLYAQAGLDPARPPQTWEELTKTCAALQSKLQMACFALGNKEGFGMEFWFSVEAASSWSAQDMRDFAAGKLAWSSPKVKAILQSWVDANAAGWFPKGANSTNKFMDEYEGFMRGEEPNTIGLISDVAHWKQFDEFLGAENDGVFLMPAPGGEKPKMPLAAGIGYAVVKTSPNAALAVDLARTLGSADTLKLFFADAGAITSSTKLDLSSLKSPAGKTVISWLTSAAAPQAHILMSAKELEELHRSSQELLNGTLTVDQAVARLDAVAKEAGR